MKIWMSLCAAAMLLAAAGAAIAAEAPLGRAEVETVVREYLLAHPEVVMEALQALEAKRQAADIERTKAAVRSHRREIFEDADAPVGGNPSGATTIAEFFDYRCPHCRRAAATLVEATKQDPQLRVVYKELPILGPESQIAARAALAARAQGKYAALHDAFMVADTPLTEASILTIAQSVGCDVERLKSDMKSDAVAAVLRRNFALAQALGVHGTPAFVIGDVLIPGAVDLARLQELTKRP